MNLIELKHRQDIVGNEKLNKVYTQLGELLKEVGKKTLPDNIIETINNDIDEVNTTLETDKVLRKTVKRKETKILELLKKELKIVPKDYHRNQLGLFGVLFGMIICQIIFKNMALGLLLGIVIGSGRGKAMDKKALEEGRQLDFVPKIDF